MTARVVPAVLPADLADLDDLMLVMRSGFDGQYGEAWSALQLGDSLAASTGFGRQLRLPDGDIAGFSLCRAMGPEVELLLIVIAPRYRKLGFGALLIETAIADAIARGAKELFLEVRENNAPARGLYRKCRFVDVGRRADYYVGSAGDRFAAITMRHMLRDLP